MVDPKNAVFEEEQFLLCLNDFIENYFMLELFSHHLENFNFNHGGNCFCDSPQIRH